jgi:hypothetical protein
MPAPKQIERPKQLLVEGADSARFFTALASKLQLTDVQVQNFGGVGDLSGFLKALVFAPAFADTVSSLAVIRDAENDAQAAFQSVATSFRSAGLPAPSEPGILQANTPAVGVFVLPNNASPGMLETLCLSAINSHPEVQCVNEFVSCVQRVSANPPVNLDKARLYAYLASRPRPGLRIGEAAEAGLLSLDAAEYGSLSTFIASL